jgi:hypothetical protein
VGRNTTFGRLCLQRLFKGYSVKGEWEEPESDITVKEDVKIVIPRISAFSNDSDLQKTYL